MTQNCIWKFTSNSDLSDYTLIVPSVAVGNVGQLVCDLLISTLNMKKIASVYSLALIPILGHDPYDLSNYDLSSCCEVYKCSVKKIVVLQLRAPLAYKFAKSFLENVVRVFKEKHLKEMVILSSSFAHEKKQIATSSYRYLINELCAHKASLEELGWTEHEKFDNKWKIYGGGFATLLFDVATENDMPSFILFKYCSEGDNIPDAYDMLSQLNDVIPLFKDKTELKSQLIQPVSWKMLFGRPPPQDIY